MNGIYDYKKNIFTCRDETDRLNGDVAVCHKGVLFSGQKNGQHALAKIARQFPGVEGLRDLNGQFAIAIADTARRSLSLIRDQFGVVPLYYALEKDKVIFGTMMKPIIAELSRPVSLNGHAIHEYFMFKYVSGKSTLFEGIYEVKPGSIVEINQRGEIRERDYYSFDYSVDETEKNSEPSALFEDAFWNSVAAQTYDRGRNEIGVLSSGGIDSSILVSCAQKTLPPRFKTYYAGYEGYAHNRLREVNDLSKRYNTNHKNIIISSREFSDNLIKTIAVNEEPLNHPSSVVRNCLYDQINNEVDVLLSGEGADCFYCGYYIFDLINVAYVKNPLRALSSFCMKLLPDNPGSSGYSRHVAKIRNVFVLPPDEYAIFHDILPCNSKRDVRMLLQAEFPDNFALNYTSLFRQYSGKNILNIILNMYQTHYIIEALKTVTKLGDAHGIEHRHPFIDLHLIDLFNRFSWKNKIKFFTRKHQVVELGKKHLPRDYFKKKKEGFGVPLDTWFYDESGPGRFINLLTDKKTRERGLLKVSYLDELLKAYHRKTLAADSFECIIWPIINFELWHRIFLDRDLKGYE